MTKDTANWHESLIKELTPYYDKFGYKFLDEEDSFVKGGFIVKWHIHQEYEDQINYCPILQVWNKSISTVTSKIWKDKAFPVVSSVTGNFLAKDLGTSGFERSIMNGVEMGLRYSIDELSKNNLKKRIQEHYQFMDLVGFRFFERYSSLEKIHDNINVKFLEFLDSSTLIGSNNKISFEKVRAGLITSFLLKHESYTILFEQYKDLFQDKRALRQIDMMNEFFVLNK